MFRNLAFATTFLLSSTALANDPAERWLTATLGYEAGPAYVAQNDGEEGEAGTRYDAADVGQRDNLAVTSRTSLELARRRHTLVLLYAPFELRTQVNLDRGSSLVISASSPARWARS